MGYEQMRRNESLNDGQDHWEPTGTLEFRLDSGEVVDVRKDGTMRVVANGVELKRA